MGWPKKNEGYRIYFERKGKSYLLVDPLTMEYVGELFVNNDPNRPTLCTGNCSYEYLYRKCERKSWLDLPEVWKTAFLNWIDSPKEYRGLFRTNELKG